MKRPSELMDENKVAFYGDFIPAMVFLENAVTEAIECLGKTGQVYVINKDMLHRLQIFADLLDYEVEVMDFKDGADDFYYMEIV
ncbi:hypothetical protein ACDN41_11935 [Priestia aryabhattai]|uniref:hypothetical protein n=1 Tax=Priestia aryabhattai TaxID=412384 RepID=UPI003532282A